MMPSVGLEDDSDQVSSERYCGSYSLSADVSESESCSSTTSFSCRRFDGCAVSSSITSSPRVDGFSAQFLFSSSTLKCEDASSNYDDPKLERTNSKGIEMMKERFSKLLLGEDMSGSGKGVCTALAISNAITNLSASVFGELWKLKPLAHQKKAMWRREMEWLLCICDSIVEMVPTVQQFPGGGAYEVMKCRPRSDLYVSLPALKKLDAMLLSKLDSFQETEFWYMDRGITMNEDDNYDDCVSTGRVSVRHEEKWWLPCPKVEPSGLSNGARKALQNHRDRTNQILKAAMAINSSVLSEMEIPSAYIDSLPKNGRDCIGETIHRAITAERFSPEEVLDCVDTSTEHITLDLANRIEAAVNVWQVKERKKHGKAKKGGKHNVLAKRAEALLVCLRRRNPGLPQTVLDMNKIQYNKDVGQAILESYSRVLESLAFNIMARIDDVVFVDDETKKCIGVDKIPVFPSAGILVQKRISPSPFSIQHSPFATPAAGSPVRLKRPTKVSREECY